MRSESSEIWFFTLRVSLFSISHSWAWANSSFINNSSFSRFLPEQKIRQVSLANKIVHKLLVELLRSVMHIKNSNGPRINPWHLWDPTSNYFFCWLYVIVFYNLVSIGEVIFNPSMTFALNTIKINRLIGYYDLKYQILLINQEKSLLWIHFCQWLLLSYQQDQLSHD